VHELTQQDARRIALRAQLLTAERPSDLMGMVRHLTLLPTEPTAPIATSYDLLCWSRLGAAYDPGELETLVQDQRLVHYLGFYRPVEDLPLHRAEAPYWPGRGDLKPWVHEVAGWFAANEECRQDILATLRAEGPLPATALPDTCQRTWGSSGWTNNKNVQQMLWYMLQRDEVAIADPLGREKLWDLAERVYDDQPLPDPDEALAERDRRRLLSLGVARPKGPADRAEPTYVRDAGEPAVVEGVKGTWRVEPAYLEGLGDFEGRAALLSPFDRLVMDRKRLDQLFGFDYVLEMYKPKAQRIWGYYALPVLYGDRLVGKLDATAERGEGVLRVDAVHEDEPFTAEMRDAVDAEIEDLAAWLGLEVVFIAGRGGTKSRHETR
jgi:uncharacterized protein YcaQ